MAVLTRTIQKTGGDYSTVAAWVADAPTLGTDIWKGVISDNENYDENVTLTAAGTASLTSYLWLTSDPANRHSGVAGTGHARMYGTGASHIITIDTAFTRVDWLDIKQDQAGASDEAFRLDVGADDVLLSCNLIWTDSNAADQDGIYTGNYAISNLRIDNCVFYGWRRAGIHIQQFQSTGRTISLDVDHCSFYDCGVASEVESGAIFIRSSGGSDVITIGLYNTWAAATQGGYEAYADGNSGATARTNPNGSVTWNGSNNAKDYTGTAEIDGTNNLTSFQDATDGIDDVTKTSGSWIVVNNIVAGSEDLLLLDEAAGNLMAGNGTDRQGSEPDSRQDFSVDIAGNARPTTDVDIGAHQFTPTGGGTTVTPATIVTSVALPTPTILAAPTLTPAVIATTATVPVPTVVVSGASPDIVIQADVAEVPVAGLSVTPTTVSSLTSAFVRNQNNQKSHAGDEGSGSTLEADDVSGRLELTAVNQITFTRTALSKLADMRFQWELWEYVGAPGGDNEFIVRSRNTVSLTGVTATQALDTTPTNIDRCIPFITGVLSTQTVNSEDALTATAYINDAGDLAINRGGSDSAGTTTVQVVTVEFVGSAWSVGHGRATGQAGDTGTITLNTDGDGAGGATFDVTDWATAAIFGNQVIEDTAEGLAHQAVRYLQGANTTTVDWAYDAQHSATNGHVVHVLRHADLAVTRYNAVSAGNEVVTRNIDVTSAGLTDLAQASVIGFSQTNGAGDALARGWRNYRFTSLTNVEAWCHRTGNTMQHQIQVLDLIGIVSAPPGGTTVTPAAVATVSTVLTPTVTAASQVTPVAASTTVTIPTPTTQGAGATTPNAIATVVTVPSPLVTGAGTLTPAAVQGVVALPTPIPTAPGLVTPAMVMTLAALPTPLPLGGVQTTAATIDVTAALNAPNVSGAAVLSPSTIAAFATLATPTPRGQASSTPASAVTVVTLAPPTITIGKTVTPTTIMTLAALSGPTVSGAGATTPATIVVVTALPTPTTLIVGAAVANPDTIAIFGAVPTPSIQGLGVTTPGVVVGAVVLPTPSAVGLGLVTPATVFAVTAIPIPTLVGAANVSPALIPLAFTVPSPSAVGVIIVTIYSRDVAYMVRHVATTRLGIRPANRGRYVGRADWEIVSAYFVYNGDGPGAAAVHDSLSAAWAANSGADTATLTAAINTDLQTAGYRSPSGGSLT